MYGENMEFEFVLNPLPLLMYAPLFPCCSIHVMHPIRHHIQLTAAFELPGSVFVVSDEH